MNPRNLGRFVSSVLTLLMIAVAVPIGLMAASSARFGSSNPLAGTRPPWNWGSSDVGEAVSGPLADATVIDAIVRASLCIVWVAVVVIVVTTVGEFVHALRHRGLPLPDRRGLGWAQRIARFIAIGLITIVPLATPATSLASTLQARPAATTAAVVPTPDSPISPAIGSSTSWATSPAPDAGVTPHVAPSTLSSNTHTVGAGESIYSIAVDLAGSNTSRVIEIADAIIDANLGATMPSGQPFTSPAYIETGWAVTIPTAVAGTAHAVTSPAAGSEADLDSYVVESGDTLWDIAEEHLGDPTAWPEIWEQNAGDEMGAGRTFDDPNLIIPGWELELSNDGPTVEPPPADEQILPPPVEHAPTPVAEPAPLPPPDAPPQTDPQPTATTDPTTAADPAATDIFTPFPIPTTAPNATATSAPTSAPITTPSTTTTTVPMDTAAAGANGPGVAAPAPQAPSPIRLEHAALLAAGILALVGVRRRQRLRAARPRHRVPEPHPDIVDTERRLRTVGASERALRVDVACRAAAWSLIDTGSQIGWVIASTDGAIELQLTAAATLPPPWEGSGQTWRLGAEVPVELLSEDARQVGQPCVALVQLGVTADGDEVIMDLEAAGQLAITARADQADEIVTAIAASLASSLFAEVAHLIGVSLPPSALLGHRNAHLTESRDAAFDLAMTLTGTTTSNDRTSFELRSLRTGGEAWEPAVVLLRSSDDDDPDDSDSDRDRNDNGDEIVRSVIAGHGVAVVIVDEQRRFDRAGARLTGTSHGWQLAAFDAEIELTPIGVGSDDLTAIADLLADASRELEPVEHDDPLAALRWADETTSPSSTTTSTANDSTGAPANDTQPDHHDDSPAFVTRPHEIVVGLLGAVNVRDRDGQLGSFERSKTVELIAWLATHRDRATRSGARTALWEMDVRDATFANVVSEARRKLARLVAPPDGEEWVARTLTEQLPLHELVVTDADLVEERLAHARVQPPSQAIETLRPAVELVREMPFAGTGYLWPDAEGLTSNLVMLAITATAEYAAHALSLGDTDGVFWATGQGLKVLSGHEELIALRMQAHARSGDLAGVRQEWESYERVLVADAWSDGEPAPQLLALRRELLSPTAS